MWRCSRRYRRWRRTRTSKASSLGKVSTVVPTPKWINETCTWYRNLGYLCGCVSVCVASICQKVTNWGGQNGSFNSFSSPVATEAVPGHKEEIVIVILSSIFCWVIYISRFSLFLICSQFQFTRFRCTLFYGSRKFRNESSLRYKKLKLLVRSKVRFSGTGWKMKKES